MLNLQAGASFWTEIFIFPPWGNFKLIKLFRLVFFSFKEDVELFKRRKLTIARLLDPLESTNKILTIFGENYEKALKAQIKLLE